MRRTLLSVLVAIASFAVTSTVLVAGFALVAGHSSGPAQGSSAKSSERSTPDDPSPASSDADPTAPDANSDDGPVAHSDSATGPLGGTGIGLGPASGAQPVEAGTTESEPKNGVLSQDFRTLGIDDPTTVIDESLRSACDVVGGTIAGPVFCNDR